MTHLLGPLVLLWFIQFITVLGYRNNDPEHITAILGQTIHFNCHANFPNDEAVPYVVQWEKRGADTPIFIWYDNYPTHCSDAFIDSKTNHCRIAKVDPDNKKGLGVASLNLTNIKESDRGWYNCKVVLLNRQPEKENNNQPPNGTWYHLSVHAAPKFVIVPKDIVYVGIGDNIILNCQAEGKPDPEILWFKHDAPVIQTSSVKVVNDGTELRINRIRQSDLSDYTCVARNGEGRIHQTVRVVIAGGAVITNPPLNQNKTEGDMVNFSCEGEGTPGNLSISWYRDNTPIHSVTSMQGRVSVKPEGALIINPVKSEDAGTYVCEVTNGIGRPQRAPANLEVTYPARVIFTPTIQYLPLHLSGIIHCHIESHPPFQFITWTKDKRIFDPFEMDEIQTLTNGSLLITKVTKAHAGDYTCTPYNTHGTSGTSGVMQVHVRDPPTIKLRPEDEYFKSVGEKVTFPCSASGSPAPTISWRRTDDSPLPKKRHKEYQGTLTISGLQKKDHGIYECVVTNEVATLTARTTLIIEKTTPHAPGNVTVSRKETFAVTIEWLPGYSGCTHCEQTYKIRYREKDSRMPNWIELPVNPPNARKIQIHNLSAGTTYEFQVIGINDYGDGMMSQIVEARTKDIKNYKFSLTSLLSVDDLTGSTVIPLIPHIEDAPEGQKPGMPINVTVDAVSGGWVISWKNPEVLPLYYTIEKKEDSQSADWEPLTDHKIEPEEASYLIKNMGTAKAYVFRVYAHSATSYTPSDNFRYAMPENVKRRAITAGLIGGVLFFIVAIIVSVCTVKICNRRKRRKQEQALKAAAIAGTAAGTSYNMVACRLTDARNGGNISQVPLKRLPQGGVPVVNLNVSSLKRGLLAVFDCVSDCVLSVESGVLGQSKPPLWPNAPDNTDGPKKRKQKQPARYSIRLEYSSPGGSKLARTESMSDEGGFDLKLPPNRFRTRSIAIVAGYSPERLYSNMPPGAFVVESGVYKVGADRDWVKSEPIYWKQVVYGSRNGSEGSGTYPRGATSGERQVLHEPRLVPDVNLELHGGAKLRASSPLDQARPLIDWMSPRHNYSDISSVPHPNSAERSFPSTLLTNPLSSMSSPNFSLEQTQSSGSRSRGKLPSLRTIPEDSRLSVQADIHASEYSNLAEYSTGDTPLSRRMRYQQTSDMVGYPAREWSLSQDISFPGHQVGLSPYTFPAPVHRAISPSKQYPAFSQAQAQQASHIQPPKIPDIRVGGIDPKEVDIYQRIAQLDPENTNTDSSQRPLATSSPPGKRKQDEAGVGPRSVSKPRFPTPTGPGPPRGLTPPMSASGTRVTFGTPVKNVDTLNLSQSRPGPQVATQSKKLPRPGVLRNRDRDSRGRGKELVDIRQYPKKDSEINLEDSGNILKTEIDFGRSDVDTVSVVSEGLDAEVTAITSSSSPGSSGSNTLQPVKQSPPPKTSPPHSDVDRSSSSGIASKNTSQNQTSSSHSTSGSASLQQTSLSPGNISTMLDISNKPQIIEEKGLRIEDTMQVLYENWPPRPHQYAPSIRSKDAQFIAYNVTQPSPTITSGVPPFTTHLTGRYPSRTSRTGSSPDTSLESPTSRSSRPNSSQSAPLDRSVDRHYEWDKATVDDTSLPSLPPEWGIRRSPAYNPRRDRDIGHMAQSNRERVFSDSEIYSNVFPRRRLQMDVEARVRAMKKEFKEFRKTQNISPNDSDRLESLI